MVLTVVNVMHGLDCVLHGRGLCSCFTNLKCIKCPDYFLDITTDEFLNWARNISLVTNWYQSAKLLKIFPEFFLDISILIMIFLVTILVAKHFF